MRPRDVLPPYPTKTRCTSPGPCMPWTISMSMSPVRLGPEIPETYRGRGVLDAGEPATRATPSYRSATTQSRRATTTCLYGMLEVRRPQPVSYTHLRAHETVLDLVCRLLLEK